MNNPVAIHIRRRRITTSHPQDTHIRRTTPEQVLIGVIHKCTAPNTVIDLYPWKFL